MSKAQKSANGIKLLAPSYSYYFEKNKDYINLSVYLLFMYLFFEKLFGSKQWWVNVVYLFVCQSLTAQSRCMCCRSTNDKGQSE